ncbi:hypothetical protein A2303_01370 [Candidatus Falkowbacteria bacterium RIFOXYB2_FULL_47_14]|uniref:Uncharacterized protein n=1 Tax=Candidatus Falkowbacteria bacterium RIFOXYA2_FULL_47_19 TaxID=1797994 RepID=A0A1F5SGY1_9BACT|nr:MAG: hypothetical protein A2227_05665 [Candidatus Falkowbacteria bacterium RIFOXYA2_FULL_47_19]OGF34501.1 MAG: hypothetical protein A2468_04710 [Candidatus Falkowbacteria bacterium RIFOXYC2_FULL_46_15]OGF43539.1 MAG: hypothetical protein A2303_01370 [Candidatus Falkowbacteria bacterium RIFOXYB2_FULL_47_14]
MLNHDISRDVLKTIEEKHIKPKPRWTFLLKDYAIWILGAFSLIVGSLAFSVIIYMLKNNDWEVYRHLSGSLPGFVVITMPYFWLIFLAIFTLAVHYNFKHTKTGYRYRLPAVIAASMVLSVVLGGILYGAGVGRAIDDVLSEKAPGFYRVIVNPRMDMWARPDQGFLLGLIIDAEGREDFRLLDFDRRLWDISAHDAKIPPFLKIEAGSRIKMIGDKTGENGFRALIIMPVGPGRGMLHHPGFMLGPGCPMDKMAPGDCMGPGFIK